MALDGAYLFHLKKEMETYALNAKVDKIYQPNKDELVFFIRNREGIFKLLLSSRANNPRINFIKTTPENPKVPPMLCMLFRKKLIGAKLVGIRQNGLERVLLLDFDARSELSEICRLTLVVEIMGKYSNIILIDDKNIIIDSIKRVDNNISSKRLILPGLSYTPPPPQNKLSIFTNSAEDIINKICEDTKNKYINKALLDTVEGFSPIICREIEYLAQLENVSVRDLSVSNKLMLVKVLEKIIKIIKNMQGIPYLISDKSNKPIDIAFIYIKQYGSEAKVNEYSNFSEAVDVFFHGQTLQDRMKSKTHNLLKLTNSIKERLVRKIIAQKEELDKSSNREELKLKADLLQSALHTFKKGQTSVIVNNYYNASEMEIQLDPKLTPAQNAQKYYKSYRKAQTAEKILKIEIEKANEEILYIDSVNDELLRAETDDELNEIREELYKGGYIRISKKQKTNTQKLKPINFICNGFTILVGRNNIQNDLLTFKVAKANDIWLHTKNIPGAHTIIITDGKEPDKNTLIQAAQIAASYSSGKNSQNIPVDYTQVKNIKKISGAKPGRVTYSNYKTLYITPFNSILKDY